MKLNDEYMDDAFKRAAGEQSFPYKAEFWKDAELQLNDAFLDAAFQQAAAGSTIAMPDFNLSEALDDAFMDDAFRAAASDSPVLYPAGAWEQFVNDRTNIEQDAAFIEASNAVTADYHAAFWIDADQALQREGLHYEYKTTYWSEAKTLLDQADRGAFFKRWTIAASLLLLISLGGWYLGSENTFTKSGKLEANYGVENKNTHDFTANNLDLDDANQNGTYNSSNQTNSVNSSDQDQDLNAHDLNHQTTHENEGSSTSNNDDVANSDNGSRSDTNSSDGLPNGIESNNSPQGDSNNPSTTDNQHGLSGVNQTMSVIHSDYTSQPSNQLIDLAEDETIIAIPNRAVSSIGRIQSDRYNGPRIEIKTLRIRPNHELSVVAQGGLGNKYGTTELTPTLRTSLGLQYTRVAHTRLGNFELGGGLSLNHIRQNDFGTERKVSVFNEAGGVDKFWFKLQLKDMIYANISGSAAYQLNKRNSLGVMFGVDYLVFVQSNMSYKATTSEGITTVNNNWGVKDGLNKIDLRMGMGYEFDLTRRFSLQVNTSIGFFDRSDNSFITDNKTFDKEINGTVGLKYTFLQKL